MQNNVNQLYKASKLTRGKPKEMQKKKKEKRQEAQDLSISEMICTIRLHMRKITSKFRYNRIRNSQKCNAAS